MNHLNQYILVASLSPSLGTLLFMGVFNMGVTGSAASAAPPERILGNIEHFRTNERSK